MASEAAESHSLTPVRDTRKRTKRLLGFCSIWDELPQVLAEKVFALLSVTDLLRCRCVCKTWNVILSSNSFLGLWARVSPRTSWFLVYCSSKVIAAYSPLSNSWNNIPVFARCSLDPHQVLLMASSGGLLCFRNRISDHPSLTICNPLTRCQRSLPRLLQIRYIDILGMVADNVSNSYKILVTGTTEADDPGSITEVYDSLTGNWTHHCSSQQHFLQLWRKVYALWCDGSFYCLTLPTTSTREHRLLAYNLVEKDWRDLNVQMPSDDVRCPSLLTCQGRLLLAGQFSVKNIVKSIHIWELDRAALRWIEIASVPSAILLQLHISYFRCYANTNQICFSGYRGWQSVIYDISQKTWRQLPDNQACKEWKAQNAIVERFSLIGMSFEPNLVAKV